METGIIISISTILLYLLVTFWLGHRIIRQRLMDGALSLPISGLALLALSGHALVLYREILVQAGFNLGFTMLFRL